MHTCRKTDTHAYMYVYIYTYSPLQHTATHLQCVAVCVLQCVAVCCSVLQCVAVCCSVLQCVAVCCSATFLSPCSTKIARAAADTRRSENIQTNTHTRMYVLVHLRIYLSIALFCECMGWLRSVGSIKL